VAEDGSPTGRSYHRLVITPALIAATIVVGLLALAPTRRLFQSGRPPRYVAGYFAALWLLGLVAALAPGAARGVVPLLVVLYVFPFINWRAGIDRLLGRPPREVRPPMKNVTPPRDEATGTR
jgi:hypothetical protein